MTARRSGSVGIQPGGQAIVIIGAVDVVLDVLLPAPDDFHRPVDLFGDRDRLGDPVNVQPAAEAAANKMIVHLDLLRWQSGHLRGSGLSAAHNLVPDPDVATIRAYMHGAVHRLHRGVGQKRKLVDRLDLPGSAGQRLGDVAFFAGDHSGLLRRRIHLLDDVSGGERSVRAVVPVDLERGQALHRGPRAVAYDGNGIVEPHHLAHALDRHGACCRRRRRAFRPTPGRRPRRQTSCRGPPRRCHIPPCHSPCRACRYAWQVFQSA